MKQYIVLLILLPIYLTGTVSITSACTCTQLKSQTDCTSNASCEWSTSSCIQKSTTNNSYCPSQTICPISAGCAYVNKTCQPFAGCTAYTEKTDEDCKAISTKCTSDGISCIDIPAVCSFYLTEIGCKRDLNGNYCYWNSEGSSCQPVMGCDNLPTTFTTDAQCRAAITICTAKVGGGCMISAVDCKDQTQIGCVTNQDKTIQCYWDGLACKDKTCENAPTSYVSTSQCVQFLSTCIIAESGTGCMTAPLKCSELKSEIQCTYINTSICFWNGTECKDWVCSNALSTLNTHQKCQEFKSDCTTTDTNSGCQNLQSDCNLYKGQGQCQITSNGSYCYWNGIGCVDRICVSAELTTIDKCYNYLPYCTYVDGKTCIQNTCNTQSQNKCSIDYQNNRCNYSGTCQQRTCQNADMTLISHQECIDWLSTCTINSSGKGCENQKNDCTLYTIQQQCIIANSKECLWNNNKCILKTCLTASNQLSTPTDCESYLSNCTVNSTLNGCIDKLTNCSDYKIKSQCSKSATKSCTWNGTTCIDRTCTQGTFTTHLACNTFLNTCTVNSASNACETLKPNCTEYLSTNQCIQTSSGDKCIWNIKVSPAVCQLRTCENSDAFTSDAQCASHLPTCTVNVTSSACITRLAKCESYTTSTQCVSTLAGTLCYWYANACVTRTCALAPKTYTTHQECQAFSANCTTNAKGCVELTKCTEITTKMGCVKGTDALCAYVPSCQILKCEDAPITLKTDALCAAYYYKCTTNGAGCVERLNCSDAYVEAGCVTNSNGKQCAWVNGRCIDYGCSSAPSKFTTELECALYMKGCTANQSGGCVAKGQCSDAKIQSACTTDINGKDCVFSATGCRNKICTDFSYTTHAECSSAISTCTTDGTICITQNKCEEKTTSNGCLVGSDGPCLWVNGKCYPYQECSSIQFITHALCQQVSSLCTTNNITCTALTTCSQTNIYGCQIGTDGQCVVTPDALNGEQKCKQFTDCEHVFYNTHEACQNANNTCTTDTQKCITLTDCSKYNQAEGCKINLAKGSCYWNSTTNVCSDLVCENIIDTTHAQCVAAKSGCTTDGTKCIAQLKCEEYSESICAVAQGTDGQCIYDPTTDPKKCRLMKCSDVTVCTTLAGCIDNGLKCVEKGKCSTYTTESSCQKGGTDGVCIWSLVSGVGTCSVMTQCSDANSSQDACQQKSYACQWASSATGATSCGQHTCATKMKETGSCQPLYDFEKKNYNICILVNQQCISSELQSLTSATCYAGTGSQYTWDSSAGACKQCTSSSSNGGGGDSNNNSNNNNNNNNNNNTNSTDEMRLVIVLLLLIMIQ